MKKLKRLGSCHYMLSAAIDPFAIGRTKSKVKLVEEMHRRLDTRRLCLHNISDLRVGLRMFRKKMRV
jgi:hypothetical protein